LCFCLFVVVVLKYYRIQPCFHGLSLPNQGGGAWTGTISISSMTITTDVLVSPKFRYPKASGSDMLYGLLDIDNSDFGVCDNICLGLVRAGCKQNHETM
jgi:hypothetical protein